MCAFCGQKCELLITVRTNIGVSCDQKYVLLTAVRTNDCVT